MFNGLHTAGRQVRSKSPATLLHRRGGKVSANLRRLHASHRFGPSISEKTGAIACAADQSRMVNLAVFFCLINLLPSLTRGQSPSTTRAPTIPHFLGDEQSNEVRLPTAAINKRGWTVRVRVPSLQTADTMRVELEFATTGGLTTAEHQLEVRLTPLGQGHSPPQSSVGVSIPLKIPQGIDRIRFVRHVPKASFGNFYRVEILEDGRVVPDGETTLGLPLVDRDGAVYHDEAQQNAWRVLWIESDVDEPVRETSLQLRSVMNFSEPFLVANTPEEWAKSVMSVGGSNGVTSFVTTELADMPRDWRALRPYDAIMIHGVDWAKIQSRDSPQATALSNWMHAGGVVIVRDASPPPGSLSGTRTAMIPTEEALKVVAQGRSAAAFASYAQMDTQTFTNQTRYFDLTANDTEAWLEWFPVGAEMVRKSLRQYPLSRATGPSGVRRRDHLAGMVIYLGPQAADEPIQMLQWAAVDDLMSWNRHRLTRNGAEPILGSQRFFQWVIPGVAQPPVYTFMGLLGVFVILVGPVAYRKTAKAGRSYLMFAIAPALALATTGAMLGYGIISDGFGTRVRSRQITWVDGNTGDAFTRTRSTYFAGIRPADGLRFSPDSEVTLYPDNQMRSWESRIDDHFETRGIVTATPDAIYLSRDFLPSRQQKQFVVHQPSNGWGRIRVEADSGKAQSPDPTAAVHQFADGTPYSGPGSIMVSSESKAPLRELIICDSNRQYFYVEDLPAGQTEPAQRISREMASKRMGEMYKRQWLIDSTGGQSQSASRSKRYNRYETTDLLTQQLATLNTATKPNEGAFEFELQQRMQLQADLPASSFLGLTDLTADAVAIPHAEVTESIHYVIGSLP